MSLALAHLGKPDEAQAWLERAVAWTTAHAPQDPHLEQLRGEVEESLARTR